MRNACGIHIGTCHNIRVDIYQDHTKGDRYKKKRFKIMSDRQVKKDASDGNHQHIAPGHAGKGCLMYQI